MKKAVAGKIMCKNYNLYLEPREKSVKVTAQSTYKKKILLS